MTQNWLPRWEGWRGEKLGRFFAVGRDTRKGHTEFYRCTQVHETFLVQKTCSASFHLKRSHLER